MGRLLVLLFAGAAFGFIAYQIFNFLFSVNNSKSQKRKDLEKLKEKIRLAKETLVSMSSSELDMLSINQTDTSKVPGINPEVYGTFVSIYHEPLVSYVSKQYGVSATDSESFIVAMTSHHEFVYHTKGGRTKVIVDDQDIGTIHSDGNLYDMKDRLVAHIEVNEVLASHPVKIGQREVGEIINPTKASSPNPRAYTFLEPMDKDEEVLFMSLTLLSLIESSI